MNNNRSVAVAVIIALAVSGCATGSKDIASTYVSPNQYANYDCAQLAAEAERIRVRVVALGGRLDQAAQNDAGLVAVGMILFWPALFALGGTKQQEAEYARLKGEYDAIEQSSISKKCGLTVPAVQAAAQVPTSSVPEVSTTAPAPAAMAISAPAAPTQANAPTTGGAAQPTSAAMLPIASAPESSRYLVSAERFAKESGCTYAAATMNIRAATYETFTVGCATGEPRSVRCDDGVCRELR